MQARIGLKGGGSPRPTTATARVRVSYLYINRNLVQVSRSSNHVLRQCASSLVCLRAEAWESAEQWCRAQTCTERDQCRRVQPFGKTSVLQGKSIGEHSQAVRLNCSVTSAYVVCLYRREDVGLTKMLLAIQGRVPYGSARDKWFD